ncbi:MAG TPA: hypothetical protein DEA49_06100 [Petrotoga sp.]|nr:hypothetical protein [Petrotoga sp.]
MLFPSHLGLTLSISYNGFYVGKFIKQNSNFCKKSELYIPCCMINPDNAIQKNKRLQQQRVNGPFEDLFFEF